MVVLIKSNIMNTVFIIIIMNLLSNCSKDKLFKDDELSLKKKDYFGNHLRIDGYYYQISPNVKWQQIYFFYHNGIILESYIEIKTGLFESGNNYSKSRFGVFEINSNQIMFEKWYPSSGGGLPTYIREGKILNDTTFIITEIYKMKNGKKTKAASKNETYHFKQFSPKPDSTNTFIE